MTILDHVFNTQQLTTTNTIINSPVPHSSVDENVDYDYNSTRNNLHTLLKQGQEALFHALEVAKQSEHPRAFEVVGNLIKQLADINHQLLDLSEKKQHLSANKPQGHVTNNAIFVGSTAELNKMLQNLGKGE